MDDGSVIQIEDVKVHPDTGHITIRVKTVTTKTVNGTVQNWSGPVRGYGCDAAAFQSQFSGQIANLTASIKSQHLAYMGVHESLVEDLGKLKGTTI